MSRSLTTMDAAMAIATQYEHLHACPSAEVETMSVRHRQVDTGNRNLNSNTPREKKPVTYFNCKKQGHYSNECKSNASTKPQTPQESQLSHKSPTSILIDVTILTPQLTLSLK